MSATVVEATVRDQSTSTMIAVEGIGITEAPANPTSGQVLRQVIAIGDGGGNVYFATVSSAGLLQTQPGGQRARTNRSAQITTGGTAQDVFTAGQATNGFYFQNLSAYNMYIRQDGTAATATTGLLIAPNGFFQTGSADGAPTTKVSVYCANGGAGVNFYCETF